MNHLVNTSVDTSSSPRPSTSRRFLATILALCLTLTGLLAVPAVAGDLDGRAEALAVNAAPSASPSTVSSTSSLASASVEGVFTLPSPRQDRDGGWLSLFAGWIDRLWEDAGGMADPDGRQ